MLKISNFDEISYQQLEELNIDGKKRYATGKEDGKLKEEYLKFLSDNSGVRAVTVGFSDLEGRFHMLDYDKKFLVGSYENLTFDGSSVRGLSEVSESDLRLEIDWGSLKFVPADIFGPGKVFVFGLIKDRNGNYYESDMRGRLKSYAQEQREANGYSMYVAPEVEGFLFEGLNAEQKYNSRDGFQFVSNGGYYNSLPKDRLRQFIDRFAGAQRALGFENEKDHPEVAPAQFELNYSYCDALIASDLIQLYKLLARQVAADFGMTASFLPKPVAKINGSGMHTNLSIAKNGKNIFFDAKGEDSLSELAWSFVDRILNNANDLCLVMNPSVNSYRRLDPAYEAPNQIKSSAVDRTSMIRIPLGNEKSARVEVRTVAPDANPYMVAYSIFRTGLEGPITETLDNESRRSRTRFLPSNINDAIRHFRSSNFLKDLLGEDTHRKFIEVKTNSADRCPRLLGNIVKTEEILFHHEVTNQFIWQRF